MEKLPDFSYSILSAFEYDMSGTADEASDGHKRHSEPGLYR